MALAVSYDDQIDAVEREIKLRRRVYPRWVASGQMTAEKSAIELDRMCAVLDTLCRVKALNAEMLKADTDPATVEQIVSTLTQEPADTGRLI